MLPSFDSRIAVVMREINGVTFMIYLQAEESQFESLHDTIFVPFVESLDLTPILAAPNS